MEVNARLWQWHSLAAACGVDLVQMAYRDAIGEPVATRTSRGAGAAPVGRASSATSARAAASSSGSGAHAGAAPPAVLRARLLAARPDARSPPVAGRPPLRPEEFGSGQCSGDLPTTGSDPILACRSRGRAGARGCRPPRRPSRRRHRVRLPLRRDAAPPRRPRRGSPRSARRRGPSAREAVEAKDRGGELRDARCPRARVRGGYRARAAAMMPVDAVVARVAVEVLGSSVSWCMKTSGQSRRDDSTWTRSSRGISDQLGRPVEVRPVVDVALSQHLEERLAASRGGDRLEVARQPLGEGRIVARAGRLAQVDLAAGGEAVGPGAAEVDVGEGPVRRRPRDERHGVEQPAVPASSCAPGRPSAARACRSRARRKR